MGLMGKLITPNLIYVTEGSGMASDVLPSVSLVWFAKKRPINKHHLVRSIETYEYSVRKLGPSF